MKKILVLFVCMFVFSSLSVFAGGIGENKGDYFYSVIVGVANKSADGYVDPDNWNVKDSGNHNCFIKADILATGDGSSPDNDIRGNMFLANELINMQHEIVNNIIPKEIEYMESNGAKNIVPMFQVSMKNLEARISTLYMSNVNNFRECYQFNDKLEQDYRKVVNSSQSN